MTTKYYKRVNFSEDELNFMHCMIRLWTSNQEETPKTKKLRLKIEKLIKEIEMKKCDKI